MGVGDAPGHCPLPPSSVEGLLLTRSLTFHLPKEPPCWPPAPGSSPPRPRIVTTLFSPNLLWVSTRFKVLRGHRPPPISLPGRLLLALSALPLAPARQPNFTPAGLSPGAPTPVVTQLPPSSPPGLSSDVPFSPGPPLCPALSDPHSTDQMLTSDMCSHCSSVSLARIQAWLNGLPLQDPAQCWVHSAHRKPCEKRTQWSGRGTSHQIHALDTHCCAEMPVMSWEGKRQLWEGCAGA